MPKAHPLNDLKFYGCIAGVWFGVCDHQIDMPAGIVKMSPDRHSVAAIVPATADDAARRIPAIGKHLKNSIDNGSCRILHQHDPGNMIFPDRPSIDFPHLGSCESHHFCIIVLKHMRILLTNDDGIMAPGILALYRELIKLGDVTVIAPEQVQSATGHGITLTAPLLTNSVTIENAFTGIAVDGRPADCVKLALSQLCKEPPDLVVSGMNSGANVGINVIYSGTVAAAIEAAVMGVPSIAVSLHIAQKVPVDFKRASVFALQTIRQVLDAGIKIGEVININVPALLEQEMPAGVRVVRQCTRAFIESYDRRLDPRGRDYFWNSSVYRLGETDGDTDVQALREKFISVTPLQFDLTREDVMRRLQARKWELK